MTNAVNIAQSGSNSVTFRNRIINGAMVIDQRNAGASVTTTSGGGYFYSTDRFITYNLVGVNFTTQRVAEAPAGFINSAKLTFTNAFSLTTTGEATFQQVIEGLNIADFGWGTANAQSITVSFWVRSSFTGTFSVGIANDGGTRAYATTYTISAANTWEQKSVTIPGDTAGTWLTNNNAGMFLRFMLASGSNFVVSSNNAWTTRAGSYNAADSIFGTRAIGAATGISAGATWQITGVQLEEGTAASPFEFRQYGAELALCQRYFEIISGVFVNSLTYSDYYFKVTKRAVPTTSNLVIDAGSGGTLNNISGGVNRCYQETANSAITNFSAWQNSEL